MKLLTREEVARKVPERWAEQYNRCADEDKMRIKRQLYAALYSMDFSANLVDQIIGNTSWTRLVCDECEQSFDTVISIATTHICLGCLKKAVATCLGAK